MLWPFTIYYNVLRNTPLQPGQTAVRRGKPGRRRRGSQIQVEQVDWIINADTGERVYPRPNRCNGCGPCGQQHERATTHYIRVPTPTYPRGRGCRGRLEFVRTRRQSSAPRHSGYGFFNQMINEWVPMRPPGDEHTLGVCRGGIHYSPVDEVDVEVRECGEHSSGDRGVYYDPVEDAYIEVREPRR